jgi:hypothetical protein
MIRPLYLAAGATLALLLGSPLLHAQLFTLTKE